jgi:hypothetical protein
VRLVEDVDLASEVGRGVVQPVPQVADRVDAAVRRGVDLDEVERATLADRDARGADVARVGVGPEVQAVDRLGHDPREGRLPGPAWAGEQERVRDLAGRHRVAQRRDHGFLPDHLTEGLRPPAAVEGLVGRP